MHSNFISSNKTKKNNKRETTNKKLLWSKFEDIEHISSKDTDVSITSASTIECIFRSSGEREICDCCAHPLFITDEGFLACTNRTCGVIYTDIIDQGAEWRFYGADDNQSGDPTRCGMPMNPLLKESSIGCKVICPAKSSYEMRKIRRYNEWHSMPYKEKSQHDESQHIMLLANQAGISKCIIDDAMRYHQKLSEAKSFRGLNREGIIAATIYISARLNNCPRTAKEIATIFHLDNTSATKGCKNAMSIINELEQEMNNNEKTTLCNTTPISFIERYCSKLNINTELTKVCKFIATRIEKNNLIPENTPHSIAAGIVYFVSQEFNLNVSKKNVNNVSEISEVTINKCHKKLETLRELLIPQTIRDKYAKM
jgi:transcription initiation factor TFIIB